jgi:pimeloyl-ACP methyl ester carboxylesterase
MVATRDLKLADGRLLRGYDSADGRSSDALTVLWHHGSPQTGAILDPILSAANARGIRVISYGRPSYGGSSPNPGRDVASAAADVAQFADALGIARFATMGASGGGPHALACAALLPDRVSGVVCFAGVAPFTEAFDWYAGMVSPGGLLAASQGREARERYARTSEFDPKSFIAADWAALEGPWASLGADSVREGKAGSDGLVTDDLAFVKPWGFEVAQIDAPVLLVQGGQDRVVPASHADWLMRNCRSPELWLRPADGHVSILNALPVALDWLLAKDGRR